jgi:single-strand DNA-binding protein
MSRGINKVIIVGNLGADPETRYTPNGNAITTIRVATSESWIDKHNGQKQERTEWHRIKFFGKLADIAGEYAKKGRQVYVEGQLRTDKYTDKEGIERFSTDIIGNQMQLLGPNPNQSGQQSRGTTSQRQAPPRGAPPSRGGPTGNRHLDEPPGGYTTQNPPPADFEDDDIPFS